MGGPYTETYATGVLDQIELRWPGGQDFGPIAFSGDTARSRTMWERRLNAIGMVEAPDDGQPPFEWSCAYLRYADAAAFLWRTSDEHALPVSHDRAERHALVARALVGPPEALTPRLAISLAASGPVDCLGPQPGRVQEGAPLDPVPVDLLHEAVGATEFGLTQRARTASELEHLVAGVLAEPNQSHSVILPGQEFVKATPAVLLWGLLETAGALLDTENCGWNWSFSTHEPYSRGQFSGTPPHLVFRSRRVLGPAIDLCARPGPASSRAARAAERLAGVYRAQGASGVNERFGHLFGWEAGLGDKIAAILEETGWDQPGDHGGAYPVRSDTRNDDGPPYAEPHGDSSYDDVIRYGQASGYQPVSSGQPVPAGRPVPAERPDPQPVPQARQDDVTLANQLVPIVFRYASPPVISEEYRLLQQRNGDQRPPGAYGRTGVPALPRTGHYGSTRTGMPERQDPEPPEPQSGDWLPERGSNQWAIWLLLIGYVLGVLFTLLIVRAV